MSNILNCWTKLWHHPFNGSWSHHFKHGWIYQAPNQIFRYKHHQATLGQTNRPPVVTIMGHVDHGKTTLLDYLRKTSVAAGEAGGITQHIGAFSVKVCPRAKNNASASSQNAESHRITFLDTPGHAAFSRMRQRGAELTDVVVLVVAAEDGLMAQTIESIRFAQAAQVPILVAVSKIDKLSLEARAGRLAEIKEQLLQYEVVCEDYGGDVQVVPISGITGEGMDGLLESLVLQGELLELKANSSATWAEGVVIESRLRRGLGDCATLLVQQGTLRLGAWLVAEGVVAKVRSMFDYQGVALSAALPSTPVEVAGWKTLPQAGARFQQVHGEEEALALAAEFQNKESIREAQMQEALLRERELIHQKMWEEKLQSTAKDSKTPLRTVMSYEDFIPSTTLPTLNLYIKSDVVGSQEAIETLLVDTFGTNPNFNLHVLYNGVGPVTETDVLHAATIPGCHLLLFNLSTPSRPLMRLAQERNLQVAQFKVIYRLSDYVKEAILAILPPHYRETPVGRATIIQLFSVDDGRVPVFGCRVDQGNIIKSKERVNAKSSSTHSPYRYFIKVVSGQNDERVKWEGQISTMRHLKREVTTSGSGMECGIALEPYPKEAQIGDIIICMERTLIPPSFD